MPFPAHPKKKKSKTDYVLKQSTKLGKMEIMEDKL